MVACRTHWLRVQRWPIPIHACSAFHSNFGGRSDRNTHELTSNATARPLFFPCCGSEYQSQTHDAACRISPSVWFEIVAPISLRIASQGARHRFSNRSSCLTFPPPHRSVQHPQYVVASLSSAPVRRLMCWTNGSTEMQHTVPFLDFEQRKKPASLGLRPNWDTPRQKRVDSEDGSLVKQFQLSQGKPGRWICR